MAKPESGVRSPGVRSPGFKLGIGAALALGTTALVLLTAALVHLPWDYTSQASVSELRRRLTDQFVDSIGRQADALLDAAVGVRMTIAEAIRTGAVDMEDPLKRRAVFLSFLRHNPAISSIEFGWADDRCLVLRRSGTDEVTIEEVVADAAGAARIRRSERYAVSPDGGLSLLDTAVGAEDVPVTQQLWYQTSLDASMPAWSNIYRLPGTGKAGVTTAEAVTLGRIPLGAIGVSIELDRISDFLQGIDAGAHGGVFLTNIYGELVAAHKAMGAMRPDSDSPAAVMMLEKADQPLIQVAVRALDQRNVALNTIDRRWELTLADAASDETYFVTFEPLAQMGLIVAIVAARADVLGEIDLARGRVLYAVAAFVLVMAVGAGAAARFALARPLGKVAENLRALEDFRPEGIRPVVSRLSEIGLLSAAIGRMSASLTSFRKYIPTDVVRTLFSQGIEAELGGERRDLTIFFMDLAGFTRLSESMGEGIIPLLGDYLSAMSEEIGAKDGTIDKYIGDAVMAFWGAPRPKEQHAEMACRAALACARRLAALNAEATGGRPALRARIGLNTGSVLVGNFGSRERLNYTVLGDAVNVASRLEALNKTYGTGILIGEATYRAAKHAIVARRLGRVAVYGREQGALIYELVGLAGEGSPETEAWIAAFEEGLDLLVVRDWDNAIIRFERVLALRRGDDGPSHLLIERARTFKVAPPPPDWDGLSVMERK